MRAAVVVIAAVVLVAVYVQLVRSTPSPEYVEPASVNQDDLKALVPLDALPAGFRPIAGDGGRENWRPGPFEVVRAAVLFEGDAGNRLAVEAIATGSRWARSGLLYARDALCSKAWPGTDCDPQFNSYRYTPVEPPFTGSEKAVAAVRPSRDGAAVRSVTFTRAGMLLTVSIQTPDAGTAELATILEALDANAAALAREHGVRTEGPGYAKR